MAENFGQSRTGRPPKPTRKPDPPDSRQGPEDTHQDRPRTDDTVGSGNGERTRGGGDERDPTEPAKGLIEQAQDFLTRTDKEIRAALGADPFQESFRPGPRAPNDEQERSLVAPRPPKDEEPLIVPGDPDDLGERGRRRRTRDGVNTSPVLRRGLLGV